MVPSNFLFRLRLIRVPSGYYLKYSSQSKKNYILKMQAHIVTPENIGEVQL